MTSAVVLNEDGKWEHYTPTSGVSGGKPLADHTEIDALRRQLRKLEAQREAGAQEINRLHCEVIARDERIAALEVSTTEWLRIDSGHIAALRRVAAARLRAVKRMKRVARHYQLLALRLAIGAELSDLARAVQSDAARREKGRGE